MGMTGKIARALGLGEYGKLQKQRSSENYTGTGLGGGYQAAQSNPRLRGKQDISSSATPESYLYYAVDEIRALANKAERNDPIANSIINKIVRGVVGSHGFIPRSKNAEIVRLINEHSDREYFCTDGRTSRAEFIRLVLRYIIRDGEALIRRVKRFDNPHKFALQIIDPGYLFTQRTGYGDQATGNKVRLGVETDQWGRVAAYHFRGEQKDIMSTWSYYTGGWTRREPAEDFIHLFLPMYAEQVRGVSWFAPVLDQLEMAKRYRDSELHAARINSFLGVVGKTNTGAPVAGTPAKPFQIGEGGSGFQEGSGNNFVVNVNDPEMLQIDSDKDLEVVNSGHPTRNYPDFMAEIYRNICAGMDVPYALITSDFSSTNYSAGQIFIADHSTRLQRLQSLAIQLENWWVRDYIWECMRDGRCNLAPSRFEKVMAELEWNPAVMPPTEPMKAAKSDELLLLMGAKSRRQIASERGLNYDEMQQQIKEEDGVVGRYSPGKNGGNDADSEDDSSEDDKKPSDNDDETGKGSDEKK